MFSSNYPLLKQSLPTILLASVLTSCIINPRPVAYYPPPAPAPVVVEQPAPMAPPAWVPAYEYSTPSRYYYMPEIQTYYDASYQQFVYFDGFVWQHTAYLPPAYASYNLNAGYVVVLNSNVSNPWVNHSYYVNNYPQNQYGVYEGPRGFNENSRQPIYAPRNGGSGQTTQPINNGSAPTPATRNPGYANPNNQPIAPTPATRNPGYLSPNNQPVTPSAVPTQRGGGQPIPATQQAPTPSRQGGGSNPSSNPIQEPTHTVPTSEPSRASENVPNWTPAPEPTRQIPAQNSGRGSNGTPTPTPTPTPTQRQSSEPAPRPTLDPSRNTNRGVSPQMRQTTPPRNAPPHAPSRAKKQGER